MRVQKHRKDIWYKCALYEVWSDMMKNARRMFNRGFRDTDDGFPVDPMFRDYPAFVLWARVFHKYKIGETDDYMIERYDLYKGFTPDNCFFKKGGLSYHLNSVSDSKLNVKCKCSFKLSTPKSYEKESKKYKWNGLSNTRLYNIWKGMIRRCTDQKQKDYPDYGGRGISVCDSWNKDFMDFYNWAWNHGYSPCLSLDRINVNGNYCPENCRWASDIEQMLNKRECNNMYSNVRLNVKDMREMLNNMPDDVVVTIVARSCFIPNLNVLETDYPAIPINERIDIIRDKG